MNYLSSVVFYTERLVTDPEEKVRALKTISEHIIPGRWDEAKEPNEKELNATSVVDVSIESASAKVRTGPPVDDEKDYSLPIWAGVVPISNQQHPPFRIQLQEGIKIQESFRRLN